MLIQIILVIYYFVTLGSFLMTTRKIFGSIYLSDIVTGILGAWTVGFAITLELYSKLVDMLGEWLYNKVPGFNAEFFKDETKTRDN
jgi:hypothetical protein